MPLFPHEPSGNKEEQDNIEEMLDAIETLGHGLTDWEESFFESVVDQFTRTKHLSDRQKEILTRIYVEKT